MVINNIFKIYKIDQIEHDNKDLVKKSYKAVILILLIEICSQLINSALEINGYSFQISIVKQYLLKDLMNIVMLIFFSFWIYLNVLIVCKEKKYLKILRITTHATWTRIIFVILCYIDKLKDYSYLYFLVFLFFLFKPMFKIYKTKKVFIVIFTSILLIPLLYIVFIGLDIYILDKFINKYH